MPALQETEYTMINDLQNRLAAVEARLVADEWHNVGPASDHGVNFENGWLNYGSTFHVAGYRLDSEDYVHLKGLVRSGSLSTIFTLPAGYRPEALCLYAVNASNALGRLDVAAGGLVMAVAGANTFFQLDGIVFKAVR